MRVPPVPIERANEIVEAIRVAMRGDIIWVHTPEEMQFALTTRRRMHKPTIKIQMRTQEETEENPATTT